MNKSFVAYFPGDLSEFMYMFVGNDFAHRTKIDKIIGPNHGRSKIEATLDTQYITGMGANITTWFWSTGGELYPLFAKMCR